MKYKEDFLFVVEDADGRFTIHRKESIEADIKNYELQDRDLDFETVAKIPVSKIQMEMTEYDIEWYKPAELTKPYADKVILAVIEYILKPTD